MKDNLERLKRAASLSAIMVLNAMLAVLVLGTLLVMHTHGNIFLFLQILFLSSLFTFIELTSFILKVSAQNEIAEQRRTARQKLREKFCMKHRK